MASVYHFPSEAVETSAISWAGSKKGEAPFQLPLKSEVNPKELTVLGKTDFRNHQEEFGIKLNDRMRHVYIIGKSGTGKSTLLENMIIDDITEGRGVILVDPHGELADKVIHSIPSNRIQDTVVLDPSDREWPVAFNLLEKVNDDFKGMVASGFVGIFKKIFGKSWGPRLEHIMRNTVLALLDSENATMLGIPRMLTEAAFRERIIDQIKDTVIRDFWVNEFGAMDNKMRTEAVSPILNKVGQFLSTPTIRNIVGQVHSTIDIRQIMDRQQILIVNLSKGKIGEDNMALLGAMIITKVQLAAMSRADAPSEQRPNCFLYVDEFQNFATESFATILSEARKYNLGLTIAHQYIAQMSEEVKDAVIGNVGSLIAFRLGSPDAEALVKEFAPVFDTNDMINLQIAHIYIKLLIDGIAEPAFSAQTLPSRQVSESHREEIIDFSRQRYSRPRSEVEEMIEETGGYRQKREAEEAIKQAKGILQAGQSLAIKTPVEEGKGANQLEETVSVNKPAKPDKPLKIIEDWVYTEASEKGGRKWYLGEPKEEVLARLEEKRLRREQKRMEADSPTLTAPPKQNTKMGEAKKTEEIGSVDRPLKDVVVIDPSHPVSIDTSVLQPHRPEN
ncbi:type IV secretory system conjugative DNA transfer family protein [Patescibacteria group bacterium]|nr:type IV secretory system conjugative DNA transfer family protein [Patescibacteria group bacterium]